MNQSETIGKLSEALSKAQGQLNGAKKDSSNPFFKSKYADLESVWAACREPLSENGLAVIQTTELYESSPCLVTTLSHSSGEWIRSVMPLFLPKHDSHTLGSALTYARRYALAAIVGIVQTDDDGNEASKTQNGAKNMNFGPGPEDLRKEHFEQIKVIMKDLNEEDIQKVTKFFGVNDLRNINQTQFQKLINFHQQKMREAVRG